VREVLSVARPWLNDPVKREHIKPEPIPDILKPTAELEGKALGFAPVRSVQTAHKSGLAKPLSERCWYSARIVEGAAFGEEIVVRVVYHVVYPFVDQE
jgi:hypothetical protein